MAIKILVCSNCFFTYFPGSGIFDFLTPLPVNRFPKKLAPNVPHNILRNPPSCSFASSLIVSTTHFINKLDSSKDLTTFMISFVSLFEIIDVAVPDPKIFL